MTRSRSPLKMPNRETVISRYKQKHRSRGRLRFRAKRKLRNQSPSTSSRGTPKEGQHPKVNQDLDQNQEANQNLDPFQSRDQDKVPNQAQGQDLNQEMKMVIIFLMLNLLVNLALKCSKIWCKNMKDHTQNLVQKCSRFGAKLLF